MTDRKNWDLYPDEIREHSPLAPTRTRPFADERFLAAIESIGFMCKDLKRLREVNAALVEMLASCEWACDAAAGGYCPNCLSQNTRGHDPGCELAALIARAKESL